MDEGVRKLPKKRKFDLSELEKIDDCNVVQCIPRSVVQSVVTPAPQVTAVDYTVRVDEPVPKNVAIDLSEWCDHRVLAKQGDWYYPGVVRDARDTEVRAIQY